MRPNVSVFCAACGKSGRPLGRTVPFCSARCRILAAHRGVFLAEDSQRFDAKCEPDGDCLIFRGDLNHAGYGAFYLGRYSVRAHRFAWSRVHGPIAEGLDIEHLCHRRACVSVSHLRPVSHLQNMRRSAVDGRMATGDHVPSENRRRGEDATNAKLTEAAVADIRARYRKGRRGYGCVALAREYGVSHETIRAVVSGETWAHVKVPA